MNLPLDFQKFFQLSRFFDLRPAIYLETVFFLLAVFGFLAVGAIIIKLVELSGRVRKKYQVELLKKYFFCLIIMGVLGIFWTWLRYEQVYILAARFWIVVWLIGLIIWLIFIWRYQFKIIPKIVRRERERKEFQKYLPGK